MSPFIRRRLPLAVSAAVAVTVAVVIAVVSAPRDARALALPTGFQQKVAFAGLTAPTNAEFARDGRVFVAEKSGLIKVFDSLAATTPAVYADLRPQVYNYLDKGLLGLALHPDFPADPRVFALYSFNGELGGPFPKWPGDGTFDQCPGPPTGPGATSDGCVTAARLSVLTAPPGGGAVEERVLIEDWCAQAPSHNIGTLAFGPDKMLYAGGGDGAAWNSFDYGQDAYPAADLTPDNPCGDPPKPRGTALSAPAAEGGSLRAQDRRTTADPTTLDGSIIRIDPDTGKAAAGNPTTTGDDNARRIVAYGMRNPFRFTLRPGTSELWIGDVGKSAWEEINRVPSPTAKVHNFGWPCYEGTPRQPGFDALNLTLCENLYSAGASAITAPYFRYGHGTTLGSCRSGGAAISGLAFYTGSSYAGYQNALFFADYTRQCVWVMKAGTNGLPDPASVTTFDSSAGGLVELQAGPGGDIFGTDVVNGRIVRYVYSTGNAPPEAAFRADRTSGETPLTVAFSGQVSSDSDGDALTYEWDLDGDGTFETTGPTATRTYTDKARVAVQLRVSDSTATDTATMLISPGYIPPAARIDSPAPGSRWQVGDSISFSGGADDDLPGTQLRWKTILHHCDAASCHEHPISEVGGTGGTFPAIDHEYPAWIELRLTVTDSDGLTDIRSLRLDPRTVDLTFTSDPAGAQLVAADTAGRSPVKRTVIVGSSVAVTAPSPQVYGDQNYQFASWSNGRPAAHVLTAPATSATYTARYEPKTNLARGKPVKASSYEGTGLGSPRAVDGNMSTRWSSKRSDPQWIRVDLGSVKRVGRTIQRWEAAHAKEYRIQVSTNGTTWRTVTTRVNGDGAVDNTGFTPVDARYVRLYGVKRATRWGYSLWEFEVYDS